MLQLKKSQFSVTLVVRHDDGIEAEYKRLVNAPDLIQAVNLFHAELSRKFADENGWQFVLAYAYEKNS